LLFVAIAAQAKPPVSAAYTKMIFHDEFDSLVLDTAGDGIKTVGDGTHPWCPFSGQAWHGPLGIYADESYIGYGTSRLGIKLHEITDSGTVILRSYPTPANKLANARCFPYVTACLSNSDHFHQHFSYIGYIEFRAKFGMQVGIHPTLWLAGYKGREIDVVELFGEDRHRCGDINTFHTINIGAGGKWGGDMGGVELGAWHTYGLFWNGDSTDTVRYFMDDSCWRAAPASRWPGLANDTVSIIMDIEVGCNQNPDSTVHWPYEIESDYVRVYGKQ
jgi:hypothetical protein